MSNTKSVAKTNAVAKESATQTKAKTKKAKAPIDTTINANPWYIKSNINFKVAFGAALMMVALLILLSILWWFAGQNYDVSDKKWITEDAEKKFFIIHLSYLIISIVGLCGFLYGLAHLFKNSIQLMDKTSPFSSNKNVKNFTIVALVAGSIFVALWIACIVLGFLTVEVANIGSALYICDIFWFLCPIILTLATAIAKHTIWVKLDAERSAA